MSTDTLDRGLSLLRSATMSLESDPLFQDMLKEKERLLVAWQMHSKEKYLKKNKMILHL